MATRLFSIIGEVKGKSPVAHYAGKPPALMDRKDNRRRLPLAGVALIEEKPDGVFLLRYTGDGEFSGDTWHRSVDDAIEQSQFEFGNALGEWKVVPEEVENTVDFALSQIKTGN